MNYKSLEKIDQSTVIDYVWYGYIKGSVILKELLNLTGLKNYKSVLEKYEGYTIAEILQLQNKPIISLDRILETYPQHSIIGLKEYFIKGHRWIENRTTGEITKDIEIAISEGAISFNFILEKEEELTPLYPDFQLQELLITK